MAHVITGLGYGGAEQVLLSIATHLDRSRFDMDVYCVVCGGPLVPEFERVGCRVTILPEAYDPGRTFPYSPRQALQLAGELRRGAYDIVHTHLFPADVIGRFAAWVAGVPRIVKSLHNMGTWKKGRHRLLDRMLAGCTDAVICCSGHLREETLRQEGLPDRVVTTIYHGIDADRFRVPVDRARYAEEVGLRPDRRTVGTIGRLIEPKGHVHLLDAVPAVLQAHPDTQFLIVGDGPLKEALLARVRSQAWGERVRFLGARDDVPELLALMDVFVFPSLNEGLGVAAIEAMAANLAVVASDIRPISEVVVDGETGLLVPPGVPDALAGAINRLLADDALRQRLADGGLHRARARFTYVHMMEQLEDLYARLWVSRC